MLSSNDQTGGAVSSALQSGIGTNDKSRMRHEFFNLYLSTLPLAAIFLFDILPSRVSLMVIGHLNRDIYNFDAIFLAYALTNFFNVFVLSLSCGLDTLSKTELRNMAYLRHACGLVLLGLIPYILAAVFAENILTAINQPSLIIQQTASCVRYLIPYAVAYVVFAMLRKSLLQYLRTSLLIGLMFIRLCVHLALGYTLYFTTSLSFYAFVISDSVSMLLLLLVTVVILSRMIDLKRFLRHLFSFSTSANKVIMKANARGGVTEQTDLFSAKANPKTSLKSGAKLPEQPPSSRPSSKKKKKKNKSIVSHNNNSINGDGPSRHSHSNSSAHTTSVDRTSIHNSTGHHFNNDAQNKVHSSSGSGGGSGAKPYFRTYVNATFIAGSISCLEWWAVETFTFMVGATRSYEDTSILSVFFVHSVWASLLLLFQMPLLGLSVAMAAIMTQDIRKSHFYPAWYTFYQAMATVVIYCLCVCLLVVFGQQFVLDIFLPMSALTASDYATTSLEYQIVFYSNEISYLFIVSMFAYGIAMCFLGLFVSVGRLARGGFFMLVGYYISALVLAIMLGFVMDWKLYGIWFGYCSGFVVWCVLSAVYWTRADWKQEMKDMQQKYAEIEKESFQNAFTNYGSTGVSSETSPLNSGQKHTLL